MNDKTTDFIRLAPSPDENTPPLVLSVPARRAVADVSGFPQLNGRPRLVLLIGAGRTGKTTFGRWYGETARLRGFATGLATIDSDNRELANYFCDADGNSAVMQPDGEPLAWLHTHLLRAVMTQKISALVDFGGGETTLRRLAVRVPGLVNLIEASGVDVMALYFLSPRVVDLTVPVELFELDFAPAMTCMVLNEQLIEDTGLERDPDRARKTAFGAIRRHPAYQGFIKRGAVELWMPRLHGAAVVEGSRSSFDAAARGADPLLGEMVRSWLEKMDATFGWLLT